MIARIICWIFGHDDKCDHGMPTEFTCGTLRCFRCGRIAP